MSSRIVLGFIKVAAYTAYLMATASVCQPRLFIIGHTRAYRLELAESFQEEGYAVSCYASLELAMQALGRECPEVVVLGWMQGSLDLIKRYGGLAAVLVVTKRDVLLDAVQSLKAGAADYIRLPCYIPEILARVERAQVGQSRTKELKLGDLSLDVASGQLTVGDEVVTLNTREASILAAMMQSPGKAILREALMRVAGITHAKPTIMESYMKQLRKKHRVLRQCIQTKYGQGYGFFPALA